MVVKSEVSYPGQKALKKSWPFEEGLELGEDKLPSDPILEPQKGSTVPEIEKKLIRK